MFANICSVCYDIDGKYSMRNLGGSHVKRKNIS